MTLLSIKSIRSILFILLTGLIFLYSCKEKAEIDQEKPIITINPQNGFPQNCDTLYFGESFTLKVLFTDNLKLGAFSIDIHHNFDHHSHSTEVTECNLDPVKTPVNPFVFIQDYSIPEGLMEYETNLQIDIPAANGNGVMDEGDYHFFISLTDKEGWSVNKGLSIKILYPA